MTGTKVKFGIVVFPGSNCDYDAYYVCKKILDRDAEFLWHKEPDLKDVDVVVLPGGFSYGDYLRCGAIARFSPVMDEVVRFAKQGGTVVGICNGFQILLEAGLLEGVLLRNKSLKFICKYLRIRVEDPDTRFTNQGVLKVKYWKFRLHMVMGITSRMSGPWRGLRRRGKSFSDTATLLEP